MSDTWKTHKQVCVGKLPTEKTETWENTKYKGFHRTHVILYVPTGTDNDYKHHPAFSKFNKIVIDEY